MYDLKGGVGRGWAMDKEWKMSFIKNQAFWLYEGQVKVTQATYQAFKDNLQGELNNFKGLKKII